MKKSNLIYLISLCLCLLNLFFLTDSLASEKILEQRRINTKDLIVPCLVHHAWARATVEPLKTSAIYMQLEPLLDVELIGAYTKVAKSVDIHQMKMDGEIMRMQSIKSIYLSEKKPFEFSPNGFHLMLNGVYSPLKADNFFELVLFFQTPSGEKISLPVQVQIRSIQSPLNHH